MVVVGCMLVCCADNCCEVINSLVIDNIPTFKSPHYIQKAYHYHSQHQISDQNKIKLNLIQFKLHFLYNIKRVLINFNIITTSFYLVLNITKQQQQTNKQTTTTKVQQNTVVNVRQIDRQMNDLRLLYEYDKQRKIVNLEYKQITSIQPLLPILTKFQNLQSLSLCGNRLKSLPNMQSLTNLAEIDLSSNLFSDYKLALKGLKSLPSLRHLIYTFKNDEQQTQLKNQLPNLERLNKKPLNMKITVQQKKIKKNSLKLEERDLEEIGQVYDDIREVYKKAKYMVDKELMSDFDKTVDIIMADLSSHLSSAKSSTQADSSIITCRYGLIDMCFTKMITYFYHFDKSVALVLQKIHDYIAQLFKSTGDIMKMQEEKIHGEITNVKLKKEELYKAQIKRLKTKDQNLLKEIDYLERKNTQLLRLMAEYGKGNNVDKFLVSGVMRGYVDPSPSKDSHVDLKQRSQNLNSSGRSPHRSQRISPMRTSQSQSKQPPHITKNQQLDLRKSSKSITLHQLREVITDIYACKLKQNRICQQSGVCIQTMQQYLYTYLNHKYGLKSLTIEWAMGIVTGIKKYSQKQPQIALFGKVLRNQIEESFHLQVKKIKSVLSTQIKRFKPNGGEDGVTFNQAQQILLNCRYHRDTISLIMPKLRQQFQQNNKIPIQRLQGAALQYLIKNHEQQLSYFIGIFKKSDRDQNGIVNRKQLLEIVDNCGKQVDAEMLFEYLDPFLTDKLTFSWVYQMFLKDQAYRQILKKPEQKDG